MLLPLLLLALSTVSPASAPPPPTDTIAQGGPRMPRAALPAPTDVEAVHRYIEGLAFDADEARAMMGFDILVQGGEAYAGALSQLYLNTEGDVRCRWVAGQALGRLSSAPAQDAIRRGLQDPMPLARIAAVQAIPLHRPPDSLTLLQVALKDKAAVVRGAAADSLGALGQKAAIPALLKAYDDPLNVYKGKSLFVRHHIVTTLGVLGSLQGGEVVLRALATGEEEMVSAAREALTRMTGQRTTPLGPGTEVERWAAYLGIPAPTQ